MKYDRTSDEVSELFVKVSGDIRAMHDFYNGIQVTMWEYLEDLALQKDSKSEEYQYLLSSRGERELKKRIAFLNLVDLDEEEEIVN